MPIENYDSISNKYIINKNFNCLEHLNYTHMSLKSSNEQQVNT